mmetsp:Transcript_64516/g.151158  ORF Transcript_64516/g.151158 Transcript_64516/m.151158 type:complete len:205 (-) Transcript_64516:204-818(-)
MVESWHLQLHIQSVHQPTVEHAACVEMVFRELSPVKEGLSGPQVEFRVGRNGFLKGSSQGVEAKTSRNTGLIQCELEWCATLVQCPKLSFRSVSYGRIGRRGVEIGLQISQLRLFRDGCQDFDEAGKAMEFSDPGKPFLAVFLLEQVSRRLHEFAAVGCLALGEANRVNHSVSIEGMGALLRWPVLRIRTNTHVCANQIWRGTS